MTIPVYEPWLTDLEKSYAKQAIDSTWISSNGEFISKAESLLSEFYGGHAIVTSSGTTALHLCCLAAGMKSGAKVLVPACTYAATAFAPLYCNASVKFVDVDPQTWNIDLVQVEQACQNSEIDFIIPVHLFGNPVDMDGLMALSEEYDFTVIEDACESIGATVDGKLTGIIGKIAAISFYGNKTFTAGEGGAVISRNKELITHAKMLRGQAQSFDRRYWHLDIGYNYRMTNIQAAILCGQLERSSEILEEKQRVAARYINNLKDDERISTQRIMDGHHHGQWMIVIKTTLLAELLAQMLEAKGIDSRPMFYPLNEMPPFNDKRYVAVSKSLSERCLMLPSSPLLENEDIDFVCSNIKKILDASARPDSSRSL